MWNRANLLRKMGSSKCETSSVKISLKWIWVKENLNLNKWGNYTSRKKCINLKGKTLVTLNIIGSESDDSYVIYKLNILFRGALVFSTLILIMSIMSNVYIVQPLKYNVPSHTLIENLRAETKMQIFIKCSRFVPKNIWGGKLGHVPRDACPLAAVWLPCVTSCHSETKTNCSALLKSEA